MTDIPLTGESCISSDVGHITYDHYHRYAACLDAADGKVVADIACGEGHGAALLAGRATQIVGIDVNVDALNHARERYRRVGNLSLVAGDCRKIPLATDSVDLIVSFGTIEHIAEHDELVEEFVRILRPRGSLIISSRNEVADSGGTAAENEFGARRLTHDEFKQLFRRHFQFVQFYGQSIAIASLVLADNESAPEALRSIAAAERSTARDATYSLAVCAQQRDALPALGSSVHLDPAGNLFREHQEAAGRLAKLEDAVETAKEQASRHETALARAAEDARLTQLDKIRLNRDLGRSITTLSYLRRRLTRSNVENLRSRRRGIGAWLRIAAARVREPRLMSVADVIRRSGLFDVGWYLSSYPDMEAAGVDPILHYVRYGWREGRDPHPLFSIAWYLQANSDVADAGVEPFWHFLQYGAAERRNPHPLFDSDWYIKNNPDVVDAGVNPLIHYIEHASADPRDPHPLFKSDWYLAQNPDVAAGGEEALQHYLQRGAAEGRDPHPLFMATWYVARNPDVADTATNPLVHFVERGAIERREHPHPLFSTNWYLATNPDVASSGMNPLLHFVRFGRNELRSPHPFFDSNWYARANTGFAARGLDPLNHYLETGLSERQDPHPAFAADWYLKNNPDAARAGVNPLVHYLTIGLYRCAAPNPDVTRDQCERLLSRITEEPNRCATPAEVDERSRSDTLPTALYWFVKAFYEPEAVAYVGVLYDVLKRYGEYRIIDSDLPTLPELTYLIDELSQLSRSITLPDKIDATIVIPVHDQIVYTLCCLKALLESGARSSFEIIIADDVSGDATASVIGAIGGIVRYHRNATNLGFTRNCNAAASLARGDTIVFLNNDTIPLPDWLDELVESLRANPSIGLTGSKLLNTDGTLQEAGGILWQDGSAWNFGRGSDATLAQFNYLKDVDYISGASIAVRASVWVELGGFDEIYAPAYCEDSDLAFRVRAIGLRTVYQPFSVVIHHEGVSHGRDVSVGIKAYQVRNNLIFTQRWKDVLSRENLPPGTDVPLARDRSRERPHLLVIDHYVPQPDRDAGSRTIDGYVRLLHSAGLQVSFWPQNRYFDRPYAQPLQRLGIEVHYNLMANSPIDEWLDSNGRYLKYVLLSRADVAKDFIAKLRAKTQAKILFYGHDIHFRRLEMEFAVTGNPTTHGEAVTSAEIERDVWSQCDVIYYPSEEERELVSAELPSKSVRAIPPFIYRDAELRRARDRMAADRIPATRQIMFIGGFRHRPNVDAMLWFVHEIWPAIVSAVPDARLCIAGSHPPPEITALAGRGIVVPGAISDDQLRQLYLSSQVAIVPLRFGAGIKGKVMEALSYGTPIVTTSVGVQGLSEAANFARISDSAEQFGEAVIGILENPDSQLAKVLAGLDFIARTASEDAAKRVLSQDVPELNEPELRRGQVPAAEAIDVA